MFARMRNSSTSGNWFAESSFGDKFKNKTICFNLNMFVLRILFGLILKLKKA